MVRKNILVLTSTFPRWLEDSTPDFVLNFAKEMQNKEYVITVVAPHYAGSKNEESLEGVPTKRFRYWFTDKGETLAYEGGALEKVNYSPIYILKLIWFVAALWWNTVSVAKHMKSDIINAHWLVPQGFTAILARPFTHAKVIVTVHGSDVFSLDSPLFRKIKVWTLKRADAVVANSSATQEKLNELYGARNYPIIPMGINTSSFSPYSNKMRNNAFQIIFVGRVAKVKGPIYLCKAIQLLVKGGRRNLSLKIVGTGPELSNLKRYVARNNLKKYITFTGWVAHKELPKFYNSADVLVAPSIITSSGSREAFGLALAEALACGTPVIGTKVGGTKDIVADKINGYLVLQKNENEIASAISELMDNPDLATIMGKKGRKWVIKNFSWAVVVKKYRSVINNVL